MSALVISDSQTERMHLYDKHTLEGAVAHLNMGDLLVGFNSSNFDTPCIEGVTGLRVERPQYDILAEVYRALGHREKGYSLDAIAGRTLGFHKSGDGASAPELAARGRWAELFDYCMNDVHLTRSIYNHIVDLGYIVDINGERLSLPAPSDTNA